MPATGRCRAAPSCMRRGDRSCSRRGWTTRSSARAAARRSRCARWTTWAPQGPASPDDRSGSTRIPRGLLQRSRRHARDERHGHHRCRGPRHRHGHAATRPVGQFPRDGHRPHRQPRRDRPGVAVGAWPAGHRRRERGRSVPGAAGRSPELCPRRCRALRRAGRNDLGPDPRDQGGPARLVAPRAAPDTQRRHRGARGAGRRGRRVREHRLHARGPALPRRATHRGARDGTDTQRHHHRGPGRVEAAGAGHRSRSSSPTSPASPFALR